MSGFIREFRGASGTAYDYVTVSVPASIPVGNSLVAAVILLDAGVAIDSVTATDTKGNVWTCLHSEALTAAANTTGHLLYAVITTALTTGDIITFTYPQYANRAAVSIVEFNDVLTPDQYATGDNGGNSWSSLVTPATPVTTQADELIVGAWYMLNAGRIFTATNGFTGLTKVESTGVSGNRAVVAEYKYVSNIGSYTANGTFNSSAAAIGMVQTFATSAMPPRSGRPKVWDGVAWTAHDAKVWDGTAWVVRKAKGYDGSTWVESR